MIGTNLKYIYFMSLWPLFAYPWRLFTPKKRDITTTLIQQTKIVFQF